jgi:hypothetical protein
MCKITKQRALIGMSGKHGADLSRLPLDLRAGGVWLMTFGCAQIGSRAGCG